jgi:hypothetical protein
MMASSGEGSLSTYKLSIFVIVERICFIIVVKIVTKSRIGLSSCHKIHKIRSHISNLSRHSVMSGGDVAIDVDFTDSTTTITPPRRSRFLSCALPPSPIVRGYWRKWAGVPPIRFWQPAYTLPTIDKLLTAFIGSFAAMACLGVIDVAYSDRVHIRGLVASMGASAVLLYAAPESPLSQPRNVVLGNIIAGVVGLGFSYCWSPGVWGPDLRWLSGALANACSILLMQLTSKDYICVCEYSLPNLIADTVHPPAGATAFVLATSTDVLLGHDNWLALLFPIIGGFTLMVCIACIVDNISLQYPKQWI